MRLGLISLLLFTFSMACEMPHETVGGYKIGCPLVESERERALLEKREVDHDSYEYRYAMEGFFDAAIVRTTADGVIQSVLFEKKYTVNKRNIKPQKAAIKEDFQTFLSSLNQRWGEADESDAPLLLSPMATSDLSFLRQITRQYALIKPHDSAIERIALFTTSDSDNSLYIRNYDKSIYFYIAYLAEGVLESRMGEGVEDITAGF